MFVMAIYGAALKKTLSIPQYLIGTTALAGVTLTLIPYFTRPELLYHTSEVHVTHVSNVTANVTNNTESKIAPDMNTLNY